MSLSVYLAARFSRKAEMRQYADDLASTGIDVTSIWIHDDKHEWTGAPDDQIPPHALARFAREDLRDIDAADAVVVFTDSPSSKGGMWVEVGYAIGRDIPLLIVGPVANVFCAVIEDRYETWPDALTALADLARERAP